MSLPDHASDATGCQVLASILHEIDASDYLQVFIDDDLDDDALKTLSKMKPERIQIKYGLPLVRAVAFVDRCREESLGPQPPPPSSASSSHRRRPRPRRSQETLVRVDEQKHDMPPSSLSASFDSIPASPALLASPASDAAIMRMLNMEMICELGKGGFGTVYEAKNLADRLKVALKIVKDPQNAIHAVREGQRLRRIKHKNIVLMHKVHDIDGGPCALEMEIVPGGDLSQHLEACRRRPTVRLPRDAVLRFSRQLLEALVYLHDECKWLHGDIKPQNILMQCNRVPADGSAVDYSNAEIKLADFGLTKALDQQSAMSSLVLSTMVGVLKGTMLYLSPEAMQGASSGGSYERVVSDDLWSACLVMLEMDTGMPIHQLLKGPGSVVMDELLTKASPELLPLLCAVLAVPSAASRCNSAAELLRMLEASLDPLFTWQLFDVASLKYVSVHPASSVYLERAFSANEPLTGLPLPPPLDLNFDIQPLLSSPAALGIQTEKRSGKKCRIRRVLKASVLSSSRSIPVWQELVDDKEWQQCSPARCAKLDIDAKNPNVSIDTKMYRRLALESGSIGQVQLPHPMKSEPYLSPAHADDIAMLNRRVHDSLPEWDVTGMKQVVNVSLVSKYAAYRHRVAARCNGNPNECMMFHYAEPAVMTKIWQEGEGHDPRLSNWAEVGKGAYFSKHPMYGYAYKYCLWPSPPSFAVKPEPPIGESMQVFVSLVCLGNIADMGPGCETCSSPAWEAWKKEPPILPKPTRPPAMTLPLDAAEKQHILDLTQVKDAPRYDSVTSTEGDLGTHHLSTNKDASGRKLCDAMHPRLRAHAKKWAEQYVLFDSAASYPMFMATLTKTRDSPMGAQQLIDAGCDVNRIKSLGFTARHVKALGKTFREMRVAGWSVLDFKNSGFDAQMLLNGGLTAADLKSALFNASEMKDAGCNVQQLKDGGFSVKELKSAGFDAGSLLAGGFNIIQMKTAKFTASHLKHAGCSVQQLKKDFTLEELVQAYDIPSLRSGGFVLLDMKGAGFSASDLKSVGCTAKELRDAGFSASQLRDAHFNLADLDHAGYSVDALKGANYLTQEIQGTAIYASTRDAMQKVERYVDDLKSLGAIDAKTQRLAENTSGDNLFLRIQIRSVTDNLVDALRHFPNAKNCTATVQRLRSLGIKAYYLLAAGFLQQTLFQAGYIQEDFRNLQSESSVTSALLFIYEHRKHWKIWLAALLITFISTAIGLALGGIVSIMVLVVCLPIVVTFIAHWKSTTVDGSRYPVNWVQYAAYFAAVFSLSMGIMLGMPSKDHNERATIIICAVCVPFILFFLLHYVTWSFSNAGLLYPRSLKFKFTLVFACVFALSVGLILGLPLSVKQNITGQEYDIVQVAWSPDGTKIALASKPSETSALVWRSSIFQSPDVKAVVIIFAVVTPLFLLFCLHYVVWKICNFGSAYPNKCKCALFLVFVFTFAISVGLMTGLNQPLRLEGHGGPVNSVAWSPDSTRIATASDDGTARVWSSSSGSTLLTLKGHGNQNSDNVNSVEWSPDGTKIATASTDGTARVWSSSSGSTLLTLTFPGCGYIGSVAWSPDGTKIATACGSSALVRSSSDGSVLLALSSQDKTRCKVHSWSPDGTMIATSHPNSAQNYSTASVWSSSSGKLLLTLTGHGVSVKSIAWSPDGTKIATASDDGTARVWSSSSGSTLLTLEADNRRNVNSVAWSPDGTRIVTASDGPFGVRIWMISSR